MHSLPPSLTHASAHPSDSVARTFTAFAFALAGAGVTSRMVFDHQIPSRPEDVVTYLATLGVAVIAGWWLANVLAWSVALRRGVHIDRFTLPGTKRIAQIMLAATLTTSCIADASGDPVMVLVEHGAATTADSTTAAGATAAAPTTVAPSTTAAPSTSISAEETAPNEATTDSVDVEPAPEPSPPPGIEHHQVIVNPGDNLWSLAAETLTLHGVDNPSCQQIANYWRLVVAANQVQSGNPDLLGIGEVVTMPAFDLPDIDATPSRPDAATPASVMGDLAIR